MTTPISKGWRLNWRPNCDARLRSAQSIGPVELDGESVLTFDVPIPPKGILFNSILHGYLRTARGRTVEERCSLEVSRRSRAAFRHTWFTNHECINGPVTHLFILEEFRWTISPEPRPCNCQRLILVETIRQFACRGIHSSRAFVITHINTSKDRLHRHAKGRNVAGCDECFYEGLRERESHSTEIGIEESCSLEISVGKISEHRFLYCGVSKIENSVRISEISRLDLSIPKIYVRPIRGLRHDQIREHWWVDAFTVIPSSDCPTRQIDPTRDLPATRQVGKRLPLPGLASRPPHQCIKGESNPFFLTEESTCFEFVQEFLTVLYLSVCRSQRLDEYKKSENGGGDAEQSNNRIMLYEVVEPSRISIRLLPAVPKSDAEPRADRLRGGDLQLVIDRRFLGGAHQESRRAAEWWPGISGSFSCHDGSLSAGFFRSMLDIAEGKQ